MQNGVITSYNRLITKWNWHVSLVGVRNEPWLQVGSLIFTITYGPEVVSAGPFPGLRIHFSWIPTARWLSHEQHGVLTSMRVPHETILEIHVSECHRHMIQHQKKWRHPEEIQGQIINNFGILHWLVLSTPPIDTTQWDHIQYFGWKPSISKATITKSSEPSIYIKYGWVIKKIMLNGKYISAGYTT